MGSEKKDHKPADHAADEKKRVEERVDAMMQISPTEPVTPAESASAIDLKLPISLDGAAPKPKKPKKTVRKKTKAAKTSPPPEVSEPAPAEPAPEQPAEPEAPPEPVAESTLTPAPEEDNEDSQTSEAVDDIVKRESDELLANHDEKIRKHTEKAEAPKRGFGQHVKDFFRAWWHKKWARYGTLFIILAGLVTLGVFPPTRYYILNTVGVRSSASLTIADQTNFQPLKNVTVEIGGHKAKTNQDGAVRLRDLELGVQSLAITQSGFATINKTVTLGLGSNPLGDFSLQPIGRQFRFKLVDYLSAKPVTPAEISLGDSNAQADEKGQLILTMDKDDPTDQTATVQAEGYRSEKISLAEGEKQSRTIQLVPNEKAVYISRASGKYDLYKIDLDGKNKKLLLAASGFEDADISVVPRGNGEQVALVSKRDKTVNQDGYPLQTLSIVNVASGKTLTLDHSERIQVIDWTGDKLVYVKVKAGTSAGNPGRYQLMTYDYEKIARTQLASANNFNDIVSAKGVLYYAASNNFTGGVSQVVRINNDNSGKKVLIDNTDVWNVARTAYNVLGLSTFDATYSYKFGADEAEKVSDTAATDGEGRFYLDSPDLRRAVYVETRDGKGVLYAYNPETNKETLLANASGVTTPLRWLNDKTVIYRVATPSETADYAVSIDGGAPKKVVDLTNTTGAGRWQLR